ncbi:low molecular weight phosphatase family protein [Oceanicaulis sp.]|uniref:arsenate-mycothiol transferase ArsC n=1 Tax=Oceanicaulis sp. TaxID=1924941 RepID=UPI003BAA62F5
MAVPSVVFVCGRNAVRSPMAEGFWKARFGADCLARSCGVEPAAWPDGFMINVMGESGVDLSSFECRDLADTADDPVELVVCLSRDADPAASAFADARGAEYHLWAIPDPAEAEGRHEARLDAYRAARDAIKARITAYNPD